MAGQQDDAEDADRRRERKDARSDPALRRLELARTDILARLASAHADAHRQMLQQALDEVEKQIRSVT